MSWPVELHRVYETAVQRGENVLPLFHSTAKAQIELTLTETGEFKNAVIIKKEDAVTVIPVTEDSAARSSNVAPMPLADKLVYLAGDYTKYANDKEEKYEAYLKQLNEWKESFPHPALDAVYAYISKGCLMQDLIKAEILKADEKGKLKKAMIYEVEQKAAFVRYVIDYSDASREKRTWLDVSLQKSYHDYMMAIIAKGKMQLCYVTGEMAKPTYKNPSKIRNADDKARLISANDESGFSYRGRFDKKHEIFSIGHLFSQKMHNGLKWLISEQKSNIGNMSILTWASELQSIPLEFSPFFRMESGELFDTFEDYDAWLKSYIDSFRESMNPETRIMVLVLDSTSENKGRVSVSYYDEIPAGEYLDNLYAWHRSFAWLRFDPTAKRMTFQSFTPYELIRAAYGVERNKGLECDTEVIRCHILNLLPCITRGKAVPEYWTDRLYQMASNANAYEKFYNHRTVTEVFCGMMRLKNAEEGTISMGYDPNETNRSYLYGCLLALADKVELDTYPMKERGKVASNARRYWNAFSRSPYQTWQVIEERLRPYLDRHPYRSWVEKQMQELMAKMTPAAFADNSRLDTMYLFGYHHYTEYLYHRNNNNEDEDWEDFE